MTTVQFKKWPCELHFGKYSNNRIAIQLVSADDTTPIAVATVNLPNEDLGHDEVFIKDYAENEGMLAALVGAGVVSAPIGMVRTGFVKIPKVKLLSDRGL
jgi:hypothetical protein